MIKRLYVFLMAAYDTILPNPSHLKPSQSQGFQAKPELEHQTHTSIQKTFLPNLKVSLHCIAFFPYQGCQCQIYQEVTAGFG